MAHSCLLVICLLTCSALGLLLGAWGGVGLVFLFSSALLLVLAGLFVIGDKPLFSPALRILITAIGLWSLSSLFISANGILGWKIFVQNLLYLLAFIMGVRIFSSPDQSVRERFLKAICVLGLSVVVFGYIRFVLGIHHVLGLPQPSEYMGRMSGTFVSPNHFSALSGMLSFLLLGVAVQARGKERAVFLVLGIVSLIAVILSGSRLALIALLIVMGLMLFGKGSPLAGQVKAFLGIGLAGLLAGSFLFQLGAVHRMFRLYGDAGMSARITVWFDTLGLIKDQPMLGHGLGNFAWAYPSFKSVGITRRVMYAHSDFLQTWAEQGAVGLGLWLALIVFCLWTSRKIASPMGWALRGSVFFILAMSLVDFPLQIPAIGLLAFLLLGACLGVQGPPPAKDLSPAMRGLGRGLIVFVLLILFMGIGKTLVAQAYASHAAKARKTLEWDVAMDGFQKSLRWNASNSLVWKSMGELSANRFLLGRKQDIALGQAADEFFMRSLLVHPRNSEVWLRRGMLATDRDMLELAQEYLQKALSLDPHNGFAHDMMAKALITSEKLDVARAHVRMALWLFPRDEVAKALMAKIEGQ